MKKENAEIKKIFYFLGDEDMWFNVSYLKKLKKTRSERFGPRQQEIRRDFERFKVDYDDSDFFGHQPDIVVRKLQENLKLGAKIGLKLNPDDVPYFVYGVLHYKGEYSEVECPNEGFGGFNFDDEDTVGGTWKSYWDLNRRKILSIIYGEEIIKDNNQKLDEKLLEAIPELIEEVKKEADEFRKLLDL